MTRATPGRDPVTRARRARALRIPAAPAPLTTSAHARRSDSAAPRTTSALVPRPDSVGLHTTPALVRRPDSSTLRTTSALVPRRAVAPTPCPVSTAPRLGAAPRDPSPPTSRGSSTSESGQASIELVVLAPLLIAIVLSAAQLLAAGAAGELADHAAEAAAVAMLQGGDPAAAARDAVPGWSRGRMSVRIDGRRVRVRMRPPSALPGLGRMLEASSEADAGPRSR